MLWLLKQSLKKEYYTLSQSYAAGCTFPSAQLLWCLWFFQLKIAVEGKQTVMKSPKHSYFDSAAIFYIYNWQLFSLYSLW